MAYSHSSMSKKKERPPTEDLYRSDTDEWCDKVYCCNYVGALTWIDSFVFSNYFCENNIRVQHDCLETCQFAENYNCNIYPAGAAMHFIGEKCLAKGHRWSLLSAGFLDIIIDWASCLFITFSVIRAVDTLESFCSFSFCYMKLWAILRHKKH